MLVLSLSQPMVLPDSLDSCDLTVSVTGGQSQLSQTAYCQLWAGQLQFLYQGDGGDSSVQALCQLFEIILCKSLNISQCTVVMQTDPSGLEMISKFQWLCDSLLHQEHNKVGWLTQSVKSVKTCHLFVPCDEWLDKKNGKNCSVGLAPPALEKVGCSQNQ